MATTLDMVIRHQIYVEGLKAGKADEFFTTINKLSKELTTTLGDVPFENLGELTKGALSKLLVSLRKAVRRVFDPWLANLLKWLERYARVEVDLYSSIFEVEEQPSEPLYAEVKNEPIPGPGVFMLPFLKGVGAYALTRIERLVVMARANRITKSELIRQFTGTKSKQFKDGLAWSLRNATNAATSTVIQHINSQTGFRVSKRAFDRYEWVAVLDSRTTDICLSRDGNRYIYGQGPVPPAHVGCRSTILPVRRGDPKTPDIRFDMWARQQPDAFIDDALDGKRSSRYERSSPITLGGFAGKLGIIRI